MICDPPDPESKGTGEEEEGGEAVRTSKGCGSMVLGVCERDDLFGERDVWY